MKHSIPIRGLALAVLLVCAGAAQAQSTVTLGGLLDLSVTRTNDPGSASKYGVDNGSMTTSYWQMRGQEDLGNGLSAIFSLESFFRADTGESGRFKNDKLFARGAYVGLASKQTGTLTLGRLTTPLFVSTVVFNAFGDSYSFSPVVRHVFTSNTVTGDSGWSDAVGYSSPSLGGLKADVMVSAGEGVGGRNWSGGLSYGIGAFSATAVIQDVKKNDAGADDTRTWQAGAAYDFGLAKVFAQYTDVKNNSTGATFKLSDVSVAVPVNSAGKVLAAYGRLDASNGLQDRTTVSVGYDHFLSKRTDVYATAMRDKLDCIACTGKSYAVGVRHRF
jgi:predicted porin